MPSARRDVVLAAAITAAVALEVALRAPRAASLMASLGFVALVAVRRHPMVAVAVPSTALVLDALAGGVLVADLHLGFAALAIACFALGLNAASTARIAGGTACAIVAMTVANQLAPGLDPPPLDDLTFFALLLGTPAVVGLLMRRRADAIAELAARARALRQAQAQAAAAATAEERARLALGVHDAIAHRVGDITLQAAGAERVAATDPDRALEALVRVERAARAALDDIREVIGVLRRGDEVLALAPPRPPGEALPAPWEPPAAQPVDGEQGETTEDAPGVTRLDVLLAAAVFVAVAIEALVSARREGPLLANLIGIAAIAAPLAFRRRAPLASAAATYGAAGVQSLLLTPVTVLVTPIVLILVPPYSLAAHAPRRRTLWGLLVCAAGTAFLQPAAPTALIALAAFGAGLAMRERSRRIAELHGLNAQLERVHDAGAARARGEERLRVARELHDAVAHSMTVIVLQAGAAQRVWRNDPRAARVAVHALAGVARNTLAELRTTLRAAEPATPVATLDALDDLVERVRPLGVDVAVERDLDVAALSPDTARVAYAVVQEALTNAVRHAAPTTVAVRLAREGEDLRVRIADSGRAGVAAPAAGVQGTGTGLYGLAERVAACGGALCHGPEGRGFRVEARLPVAEAEVV